MGVGHSLSNVTEPDVREHKEIRDMLDTIPILQETKDAAYMCGVQFIMPMYLRVCEAIRGLRGISHVPMVPKAELISLEQVLEKKQAEITDKFERYLSIQDLPFVDIRHANELRKYYDIIDRDCNRNQGFQITYHGKPEWIPSETVKRYLKELDTEDIGCIVEWAQKEYSIHHSYAYYLDQIIRVRRERGMQCKNSEV